MTNSASEKDYRSKTLDKKILTVTHILHPYVKRRLKVAEDHGIIPKNMYRSQGVIDEVIINLYENKLSEETDVNQLKLMMFTAVNKKLVKLFEKEKWHKSSISTKKILDEEMAMLEEKFTVDANNDLIMNDELDDISYHQDDEKQFLLQSDGLEQDIAVFFELKDKAFLKDEQKQGLLERMYRKLPMQTSNIMDLYVLGKLNMHEVAVVVDSEIVEVKKIIDFVKENFKKYLI